jgi:FHA domain-containing protein
MAGMRAALAGVLARFDPEPLESRLTNQNLLDSLVPMTRRAKLWDLFVELYGDIAREAEDDFHALFGREFVRAYEAQLSRLALERNRGRTAA